MGESLHLGCSAQEIGQGRTGYCKGQHTSGLSRLIRFDPDRESEQSIRAHRGFAVVFKMSVRG